MNRPILATRRGGPPGPSPTSKPANRESTSMNAHTEYAWTVHVDRLAQLHREADRARLARSLRTDDRRLRRAVGHSLVRAGQRLAAEAAAQDRPVERLTPAGTR